MATVGDTFVETSDVALDAHTPTGPNAGTGWTEIEQTGTRFLEILAANDSLSPNANENNDRHLCTIQPNPSVAEYDVQVTFTTVETSGPAPKPIFLLARLTDSSNYYSAGAYQAAEAADAQMFVTVAGTPTNIGSGDTGWVDGDICKFEVRDATKKLFKNGGELFSSSNNDITAAGQAGIGVGNAWVTTDDIGSGWVLNDFEYVESTAGPVTLTNTFAATLAALPAFQLDGLLANTFATSLSLTFGLLKLGIPLDNTFAETVSAVWSLQLNALLANTFASTIGAVFNLAIEGEGFTPTPEAVTRLSAFKAVSNLPGTRFDYLIDLGTIRYNPADNMSTTGTFRAASTPQTELASGLNYFYPSSGTLSIRASMESILSERSGVTAFPSYGSLRFPNHNKELDTLFGPEGVGTDNQPVTVRAIAFPSRHRGQRMFPLFSGIAGPLTLTDDFLDVPILDNIQKLTSLITLSEITAIDYPQAPPTSIGLPKPRYLGSVSNVTLIPVSPGNGVYLVSGHRCHSITPKNNAFPYAASDYQLSLSSQGDQLITFRAPPRSSDIVTADVDGMILPHLKAFSNSFAEIGIALLEMGGISFASLDSTSLAEMRALYSFPVSLPIRTSTRASEVYRTLTQGFPCILHVDIEGMVIWAPFTGSLSGTPEIHFMDDVEILPTPRDQEEPPVRGVSLSYAPNETVQSGNQIALAFDMDTELHQRLGQPFQALPRIENTLVSSLNEIPELTTRIINKADAEEQARRLVFDIFGPGHRRLTLRLKNQPLAIRGLNSLIRIDRPLRGVRGNWRVLATDRVFQSSGNESTLVVRN